MGTYLLHELGKALFLTALVSFGVNALIARQSAALKQEELARQEHETNAHFNQLTVGIDALQERVMSQTTQLVESVSSLEALREAGVQKVYSTRDDAAADLRAALDDRNATSIKIIGISLNDFLRDERPQLRSLWQAIKTRLLDAADNGGVTPKVQILLIDPRSRGAFLRAEAEQERDKDSTRLYEDVTVAVDLLNKLRRRLAESPSSIASLEVRLYRTAPILYLVRTSAVSFLQQYYFRPTHLQSIPIPVFRAGARAAHHGNGSSLHDELGFHFDWIWKHASIGLDDYLDGECHGHDHTAHRARIRNIYYDAGTSRKRILHLIRDPSNRRIWIKGISLRSFFRPDSELCAAIIEACRRRKTDVRILVIDPDSEQAKLRSFREHLIHAPRGARLEGFTPHDREHQRLYKETQETIEQIQFLCGELAKLSIPASFRAQAFSSAPEAFVFLTDTAAIVEQYHYGKIGREDGDVLGVLGGDVPVVEYEAFGASHVQDPYRIFEDHFKFVYDHCSRKIAECPSRETEKFGEAASAVS